MAMMVGSPPSRPRRTRSAVPTPSAKVAVALSPRVPPDPVVVRRKVAFVELELTVSIIVPVLVVETELPSGRSSSRPEREMFVVANVLAIASESA